MNLPFFAINSLMLPIRKVFQYAINGEVRKRDMGYPA